MKYAVEVANIGSLNKASEELLIAPPNLSRSIKELEADLGIMIFDRSSKGMTLTKRGEEFIHYAKKILEQIDEVEQTFKSALPDKKQFSISVPRASYIAEAFVEFSRNIGQDPVEIYYKETNPYRAIKNILEVDYKLGIVRYASGYDKYFNETFQEKGLEHELVVKFHYVLIMSKKSPLANKKEIHFQELNNFIEIAHADPFVPSLPLSIVKKEELPDDIERRIFVFERGTQFDLLSENPDTFMWVSPIPKRILECHGLVQRECPDNLKAYNDVLIYRKNYELSDLDKKFISEVHKSIQANFKSRPQIPKSTA
ncbi:MAG: LysR family transcriptional regulator [Synergistaceae bacterium]|nr:LysR family transcriptional regulator [Synergistaceae bacterium]